jgi:hypothetical protein
LTKERKHDKISSSKQRKEECTMTKREMFVAISKVAEVSANEEMMAFINHEIELIDNRKGKGSKTPTKTQKENEGIKAIILETLNTSEVAMTVTELVCTESLNGYSNQKISALLRQLVESGQVSKEMVKKKAYFSIPKEEEEAEEEN